MENGIMENGILETWNNQMKISQEKRDGNERKRGSKTPFKTKFQ